MRAAASSRTSARAASRAGTCHRRVRRAPRVARGSIASVAAACAENLRQRRRCSTRCRHRRLGPGRPTQFSIGARAAPDEFTPVAPGRPAIVVPTITVPPAVKDRATLARYSEAFKEYQRVRGAAGSVRCARSRPVDFALRRRGQADCVRASTRSQTVPARLASTLGARRSRRRVGFEPA